MDLVASDWVIWSKRKACPTSSGKTDLGCTDIHARLRCQKKTKKQERKQHRMPQLKGNYIPSLVPITIRTPSVTTLSLGNMIPPETGEHQKKKKLPNQAAMSSSRGQKCGASRRRSCSLQGAFEPVVFRPTGASRSEKEKTNIPCISMASGT